MNERIKELAFKTGFISKRNNGDEWRWGYIDPELEQKLEQFAELIVAECASICELNGKTYKYTFTPAKAQLAESTSSYCGELIKRYFGVK